MHKETQSSLVEWQ